MQRRKFIKNGGRGCGGVWGRQSRPSRRLLSLKACKEVKWRLTSSPFFSPSFPPPRH